MFSAITTRTAQRSFSSSLKKTALWEFHQGLGAKMVPFAGYDMPVQYSDGVKKEHLHTRESAGIFDVSHMGQIRVTGKDSAALLERCTVVDTQALKPGQGSLSLLMTPEGGIADDCIITKVHEEEFAVVLNAGCKDADLEQIKSVAA